MTDARVEDKKVQEMLELLLTGGNEPARNYYRAAFISRQPRHRGARPGWRSGFSWQRAPGEPA
jgi:hypothetical protein